MNRSDLPTSAHGLLAYAARISTRPLAELKGEHNALLGLILTSQNDAELAAVMGAIGALKREYVRREARLARLYALPAH